ncbi:MAG: hypothetical protein V9G19_06555 [Tetrasphaera sp.]
MKRRTRARDLGVDVTRVGSTPGQGLSASASGITSDDALRAALRSAVAAELGPDTPGVDAAIDRVLAAAAT